MLTGVPEQEFTRTLFAETFDVSRETLKRLDLLVGCLEKWQRRINLVARSTLSQVWHRHITDSAQILAHAPEAAETWVDLGAGAGFPGLVVAAIAAERRHGLRVTLVESDRRKAAFLTTAAREMGLAVAVKACRAEDLPPTPYDVVSARALAPLPDLLALARRCSGPATTCLFLKGAQADRELTAARHDWHIRARPVASLTDPAATLLVLTEIAPRHDFPR